MDVSSSKRQTLSLSVEGVAVEGAAVLPASYPPSYSPEGTGDVVPQRMLMHSFYRRVERWSLNQAAPGGKQRSWSEDNSDQLGVKKQTEKHIYPMTGQKKAKQSSQTVSVWQIVQVLSQPDAYFCSFQILTTM